MPSKPKIKVRDFVKDIRSGMTDSQLMEKHGVSASVLQSLLQKVVAAKAITQAEIDQRRPAYDDTTVTQQLDARDIGENVRSGMTDSELMKKYDLSSEELHFVLQTLTDSQIVTVEELYATSRSDHDTAFDASMPGLPGHYLAIAVDIYESKHPEIKGTLSNVTEKGIAITGITARIGETKTFVIPAGDFIEADPVLLEARCQWAEEQRDTGEWLTGFDITRISKNSLNDLRRLIQSLPFF